MGGRERAKRYVIESCIHVRAVKEKRDGLSSARVSLIEAVGNAPIFLCVALATRVNGNCLRDCEDQKSGSVRRNVFLDMLMRRRARRIHIGTDTREIQSTASRATNSGSYTFEQRTESTIRDLQQQQVSWEATPAGATTSLVATCAVRL